MTRALVFPGQGSQTVGMGRDLAGAFTTARDVFAEIDEALHQNLSRLMFEGPESDLRPFFYAPRASANSASSGAVSAEPRAGGRSFSGMPFTAQTRVRPSRRFQKRPVIQP